MSHSNVGRVLTLVIKITDDQKSKEIWNNHLSPKDHPFGFDIRKIAEGDILKERDRLEEILEAEGYEKT